MPYTYKYPHPAVTTDCVILTFHEGRLKILLIRRGIEPYKGYWALPGGFLKADESAEEGALRELREETGVHDCAIRQFHTFSKPDRDPRERVITIAFYALIKWCHVEGADDAEFADWIPINSLPPLAFDHKEIIERAIAALKRDIHFEPIGFDLLNDAFSMSELQAVYEAILGREFDRRNFSKKMKHLNILEEATDKELPLPFLNRPLAPGTPSIYMCESSDLHVTEASPSICEDSGPCEEAAPLSLGKNKRKPGIFWKLNRKNYNKIKDDDIFEF